MTTQAIKWLIYDLTRWGKTNEEIEATLHERGASYTDLVAALVEYES